jgi:hypothetical protein
MVGCLRMVEQAGVLTPSLAAAVIVSSSVRHMAGERRRCSIGTSGLALADGP